MRYHNTKPKSEFTPFEALTYLKEGNFRFINEVQKNHNHLKMINETSDGQWPFAVIVSCMDSRTSAELIFDQGIGDIFSLRIAGNIVRGNMLGSLEYACKIAGSKLIVVMGHTNCGAIKGACDEIKMGNLTKLLGYIKPAVKAEKSILENRNSSNFEFVERVCDINVYMNVDYIKKNSEILRGLISEGQLDIVAAKYDVSTGLVHFFSK